MAQALAPLPLSTGASAPVNAGALEAPTSWLLDPSPYAAIVDSALYPSGPVEHLTSLLFSAATSLVVAQPVRNTTTLVSCDIADSAVVASSFRTSTTAVAVDSVAAATVVQAARTAVTALVATAQGLLDVSAYARTSFTAIVASATSAADVTQANRSIPTAVLTTAASTIAVPNAFRQVFTLADVAAGSSATTLANRQVFTTLGTESLTSLIIQDALIVGAVVTHFTSADLSAASNLQVQATNRTTSSSLVVSTSDVAVVSAPLRTALTSATAASTTSAQVSVTRTAVTSTLIDSVSTLSVQASFQQLFSLFTLDAPGQLTISAIEAFTPIYDWGELIVSLTTATIQTANTTDSPRAALLNDVAATLKKR